MPKTEAVLSHATRICESGLRRQTVEGESASPRPFAQSTREQSTIDDDDGEDNVLRHEALPDRLGALVLPAEGAEIGRGKVVVGHRGAAEKRECEDVPEQDAVVVREEEVAEREDVETDHEVVHVVARCVRHVLVAHSKPRRGLTMRATPQISCIQMNK